METPREAASSNTTRTSTGKFPLCDPRFQLLTFNRPASKFAGINSIHFGEGQDNYVTLPIIPPK